MKPRKFVVPRVIILALSLCAMAVLLSPPRAAAQQGYVVKPVAEKKVKQLPAGPLYWMVENFPTLAHGAVRRASNVTGR
ncbi:MAG: hypothetical protein WBQ46_00635 [Terriglobales bacterium]